MVLESPARRSRSPVSASTLTRISGGVGSAGSDAIDKAVDDISELGQGPDGDSFRDAGKVEDDIAPIGRLRVHLSLEKALDLGDDETDLAGLVVGLGEKKAEEAVLAELAQSPEVGDDALGAATGVGHRDRSGL